MTPPIDLYFAHLSTASDRLRRTGFARLKTDLKRYLKALSAHPLAAHAVAGLEREADLPAWLEGLDGPFDDPPAFPDESRKDLAIRLALMRRFAEDPEEAAEFGIRLSTAHDYESLVDAVNETVFRPLTDDLPDLLLAEIQKLERNETEPSGTSSTAITTIPEQAPWAGALDALEVLIDALTPCPDSPDRTQVLAELAAAVGLVRSGRFRPHAVKAILLGADGPLRASWPGPSVRALALEAERLINAALGAACVRS